MRFGTNAGFQSLLADRDGKLDTTRRVLAGLAAGVTEALVIVTPFEVVKIRLQGQVGLDPSQLKYKGPVDAAVKTINTEVLACGHTGAWARPIAWIGSECLDRDSPYTYVDNTKQGVLAMWSGAVPTVYRNGINQATMFVAKNAVDEALWGKREGDGKQLAVWQSMASGFVATCPGVTLTSPFDIAVRARPK